MKDVVTTAFGDVTIDVLNFSRIEVTSKVLVINKIKYSLLAKLERDGKAWLICHLQMYRKDKANVTLNAITKMRKELSSVVNAWAKAHSETLCISEIQRLAEKVVDLEYKVEDLESFAEGVRGL